MHRRRALALVEAGLQFGHTLLAAGRAQLLCFGPVLGGPGAVADGFARGGAPVEVIGLAGIVGDGAVKVRDGGLVLTQLGLNRARPK